MSIYNRLSNNEQISESLSNTELFASSVTNYYWHVLNVTTSRGIDEKDYYGLIKSKFTDEEMNEYLSDISDLFEGLSNN